MSRRISIFDKTLSRRGEKVLAIFKIINKRYKEINDLDNLIKYVYEKANEVYVEDCYDFGFDGLANQFLYIQSYKGKKLITRALHFVLSFDTRVYGTEGELRNGEIIVCGIFLLDLFKDYQRFFALHTDKSHKHLHIIVNPVNKKTMNLYHCSQHELKNQLKQFAGFIYQMYRITLMGISYLDEDDGRLKFY